jgi:WD40 repeat protein
LIPERRANVFVSYARKDGEELARALRDRLAASGIALWRDRDAMEGGRDWWQQITAAIDGVEFLVLVMTNAALASPTVRREWRYARQRGVTVYPVLAHANLDLASLPRWMGSVHFYDVDLEWTTFVNDLQTRPTRVRVPFMVEDLPVDFVPRAREFDALAAHVIDREREEPIAGVAVVCGAGGYGKTALVRALCHDEAVQNAFDDGVLWVTLGENPGPLTGRVEDLIATLSGHRPGFAGIEASTAALAELLADRDVLIVIDDVWDRAHLAPFLQGGERCARIVTTRNADVVPAGARRFDVEAMRADEAVSLVGFGLAPGLEEELTALAARLGEWPLLLKLVNATLRERAVHRGQPLAQAIAYVHHALDRKGLTFYDVASTLDLSIAQLAPDEQARFYELAVFPEDVDISLDVLARFWSRTGKLDEFDTELVCDRLARLSLVLLFDPTLRFVRLHDVIGKFLLTRVGDRLAELHAELLASIAPGSGSWADLPPHERYGWTWLFHHLIAACRGDEMVRTACDLGYLAAKTAAMSPVSVEADLAIAESQAPFDARLTRLTRSYRQSAHIVARCRSAADVAATLCSRFAHIEELASTVRSYSDSLRGTRLVALHPLPDLPHPALLRTLLQPGRVLACAVSTDGKWIVAAGSNPTISAWDAASGRELRTFVGHTDGVNALAFSSDGAFLASASSDRRLRLWDAQSGEPRAVFAGHTAALTDCAIGPGARLAVTASFDGSVRIWDLAAGLVRHILARTWRDKGGWFVSENEQGHWSAVHCCAISADGRWVASGSSDQTVIVWDVDAGISVHVLAGHDATVNACAFSADGALIVSAGADRTVRLWDRVTGQQRSVLDSYRNIVTSCVFTPDERFVICGGADGSLAVIDICGNAAPRTISGHTDWVNDCAISRDGRLLVSASSDGGIKLWDAMLPTSASPARAHSDWVLACVAEAEGARVVTAAADASLIRWDPMAARPLASLVGHEAGVRGCAVSPTGMLASASADKSVRLWDLPSARLHSVLTGHRDWVNGCAIDRTGQLLASVSNDRTFRLWDLTTRSRRVVVAAHGHWVNCCAFSPDGRYVVTAAEDGTMRRWSLQFEESVWEEWILGGRQLAADVVERELRPVDFAEHAASVNHVAFAPDGTFMVSASSDKSVRLWEVESAKQTGALTGHVGHVNGCDVSPDGALVASVSSDGAAKVWDVRARTCLATLQVDGFLSSCAFIQGGNALVAVGDMGVYFLEIADAPRAT